MDPSSLRPIDPFVFDHTADVWVHSSTLGAAADRVLPCCLPNDGHVEEREGTETLDDDATGIRGGRPLRIATFNVLADCWPWFVTVATPPEERFAWLAQELPKLNADVIGLNEVTATTLRHLLGSPYVRANYYVTENVECRNSTFSAKLHGCVMLSRVPFAAAFVGMRVDRAETTLASTKRKKFFGRKTQDELPTTGVAGTASEQLNPDDRFGRAAIFAALRRPLSSTALASLSTDGSNDKGDNTLSALEAEVGAQFFTVCSIHTFAYQTEENKQRRELQIQTARDILQSLRVARSPCDVPSYIVTSGNSTATSDDATQSVPIPTGLVMGDLNMYYTAEDGGIIRNDLIDLWAETHFRQPLGEQAQPPAANPNGAELQNSDRTAPMFSDQDPGITFDSLNNGMIKRYVPGTTKRMRLDRFLLLQTSRVAPVAPVKVWASDAVDAARDVWPSDHFGLVTDLLIGVSPGESSVSTGESASDKTVSAAFLPPFQSDPYVRALMIENGKVPLETAERLSMGKAAVSMAKHVPWVLGRGMASCFSSK